VGLGRGGDLRAVGDGGGPGAIWSWFDEGRPLRFSALAAVLVAVVSVVSVAAVGIANST
jgi:hypothetical protein